MISLGEIEQAAADAGSAHPAPGMHARHYSPQTRLLLVTDPAQLPDESGAYVWRTKPGMVTRAIRMPVDPAGYAAQLYAVLHELDAEGLPWIAVEAPPDAPEWAAIRDRLQRAAEKVE
jgi:L-threonylcarbamoyladenylate synthase